MPTYLTDKRYRNYRASQIQRSFRNSRFRRRFRSKRKLSTKKKVKINTKKINKVINAQKSFHDNLLSYSANGTTGSVVNLGLNTISQGSARGQRTGDKITLKNIILNGYVQNALSTLAADAFNNIRIILLELSQPNLSGSPLAVTDFLELTNYPEDKEQEIKSHSRT